MEDTNVKQEKRFDVVIYDGVSLAIYMNRVAQELHRLIQSTSEKVEAPKGSAMINGIICAPDSARELIR